MGVRRLPDLLYASDLVLCGELEEGRKVIVAKGVDESVLHFFFAIFK